MEEEYFFLHHFQLNQEEFFSYPIMKRKWMIHRHIEQLEKENQALEKAKRGK